VYSFCVVELGIFVYFPLQASGSHLATNPAAETLFLNSSVIAFNMSIIIGSSEPAMPYLDPFCSQSLFKVATILWAIVSLHHMEGEASVCLCPEDNVGRDAWTYMIMYFYICQAAV
jgi:hypothetical protein